MTLPGYKAILITFNYPDPVKIFYNLPELMAAVCLAVFYNNFTSICGISGYLFDCDVHGVPFRCIIPNHWKVP